MPISKKLLEILACPDCRGGIKSLKRGKAEKLQCLKCRRMFAVKGGIPIMLPKDFKAD